VSEFVPDESDTPSAMPVAEIDDPTVTVVSIGNALPAPVIIGSKGVLPPAQDIYSAKHGKSIDVTTVNSFQPFRSALDFYFGLDSEYVRVQDPVAVEPTNDFAFAVAPDNGVGAGLRTAVGGLADISNSTLNSRRLSVFAPDGVDAPNVDTGDHFSGPVIGIMNEFDGNPELDIIQTPAVISSGQTRQIARPARPGELTVATYNLDNLSPTASASKFATVGSQVVTNLGAPDILAVQEIEDNDGTKDDGVVDATTTLNRLVAAIQAAGGPTYSWTEIDPVNDQDGGTPRRQHPAGPALPHRHGTHVRLDPRWRVDDRRLGDEPWVRRFAGAEPGPDRPERPLLGRRRDPHVAGRHQDGTGQRQPQAAGGTVHLPRPLDLRDQQPPDREDHRRRGLRSLPDTGAVVTDPAGPAGADPEWLRSLDREGRFGRLRAPARRPE
jgi:hypothetical protein